MGSHNMSSMYLTKHSYQIMPSVDEEEDSYDFLSEIIDDASKSIEKEIDELKGLSFMVSRASEVFISIGEIKIESGYYEGVALRPDFNVEFEYYEDREPKWKKLIEEEDNIYEETKYLADSIDQMVFNNNYTTYSEVLIGYLKTYLLEDISQKLIKKAEKSVDKYFEEVDKIMMKYTTPYTTGWCASPVAEEDR